MMIFSKLIQNLSKFIEKLSKYIQNLFDKFFWKIQSGWADPSWWGSINKSMPVPVHIQNLAVLNLQIIMS